MNRNILISYYWKRDSKRAKIKPEHEEALEERALERIGEMMAQDYTSGELQDYVRTSPKDGPDGVAYSGWWTSKLQDPETEHTGIISRSIAPFYYGGWDEKISQPIWIKDPAEALRIPISELGETVNKVAPHSRGSVNGIVNPTE